MYCNVLSDRVKRHLSALEPTWKSFSLFNIKANVQRPVRQIESVGIKATAVSDSMLICLRVFLCRPLVT